MKVIALLSLLLLTSCIGTIRPFPSGWPDLSMTAYEDCPNISGSYSDLGITAQDREIREKGCLSCILLNGRWETSKTNRVVIEQSPGGILEYSISFGDGRVIKQKFSKEANDYQCKHGEVIFQKIGWIELYAISIGTGTYAFSKRTDGSLVARNRITGGGILIIAVPFGKDDLWWERFMPWSPQSQQTSSAP